ncbi:hypothetical protein ZWY2020_042714 [Hordeum vulgare]|nr:hypothetical protein ZWY2020_042714 [Hordeum vulgare]
MWRLDTAMGVERELLIKASAAKCSSSPKVAEISEVFKVLGEMRNEMDLDAVMRRRLQKRRCPLQEAAVARPDQDEHADAIEALTKRLKTLRALLLLASASRPAVVVSLSCAAAEQLLPHVLALSSHLPLWPRSPESLHYRRQVPELAALASGSLAASRAAPRPASLAMAVPPPAGRPRPRPRPRHGRAGRLLSRGRLLQAIARRSPRCVAIARLPAVSRSLEPVAPSPPGSASCSSCRAAACSLRLFVAR